MFCYQFTHITRGRMRGTLLFLVFFSLLLSFSRSPFSPYIVTILHMVAAKRWYLKKQQRYVVRWLLFGLFLYPSSVIFFCTFTRSKLKHKLSYNDMDLRNLLLHSWNLSLALALSTILAFSLHHKWDGSSILSIHQQMTIGQRSIFTRPYEKRVSCPELQLKHTQRV